MHHQQGSDIPQIIKQKDNLTEKQQSNSETNYSVLNQGFIAYSDDGLSQEQSHFSCSVFSEISIASECYLDCGEGLNQMEKWGSEDEEVESEQRCFKKKRIRKYSKKLTKKLKQTEKLKEGLMNTKKQQKKNAKETQEPSILSLLDKLDQEDQSK